MFSSITAPSAGARDTVHHAKFYAIAAITDPLSPRRQRCDASDNTERVRSPVAASATSSPTSPSAAPTSPVRPALHRRAATDMSVLPRSVMELVFSFAVKDLSLKLRPAKCRGWKRVSREKVEIDRLTHWRSVCAYWRELIDEIVAQFKARRLKVNFSYKTPAQVLASAEAIVLRGDRLVDLRVALYGYYDTRLGVETASRIPWSDFLRHCPNLQRLDLSEMAFLTRAHMGAIVEAAAQHCLKLQALILPLPVAWSKYDRFYSRVTAQASGGDRDSTAKFALDDEVFQLQLETALARWSARGRFGGLRQLTVAHSLWTSDAFVAAVTAYCPHIEVLDGWKLTYLCDGWAPVTCDDEWKVTDATWQAFCRTCTQLREFNWAVVPFTDAFFRPFGATPKVLLTDLLIDFATTGSGDDAADADGVGNGMPDAMVLTGMAAPRIYPPPAPSVASATQSDYVEITKAYSSEGLCALVAGLPFLTKLRVYLHPTVRIDVDVFDDAFLLALTRSCPHLEQLRIVEAGQYDGTEAIRTISDRGLSALASMASLADVAITALEDVSADGVLAFVRQRSHGTRQRNVKLGVMKGIGMCIIDILKAMAKDDGAWFSTTPFALVLENQGLYRGSAGDPKSVKRVEDKMRSLKSRLEKLHPGVKCQLTLAKEPSARRDVPYRIAKFAVFSTTWSFPDALGGTFYRGDIAYDPRPEQPFEMVIRVG